MKPKDDFTFLKPQHYYAGGAHSPVASDEENIAERRAMVSRLSIFFLGVVMASIICYFVLLVLVHFDMPLRYFLPFILGIWLVVVVVLYIIFTGDSFFDVLSGKVIKELE